MDIDQLEPGNELDWLVAEHVMGIDLTGKRPDLPIRGIGCARYSIDIVAAWQVVEKMRLSILPAGDEGWLVTQDEADTYYGDVWFWGTQDSEDRPDYFIRPTAPHAICLAALKAAEANVSKTFG